MDGAIQIYEGVNSVISIIDALTAATGISNTVTTASGVAATTAATAKVAAAAPEEVAASVATMAAVKAEAMAYRELAASEFMAAHAYIPFAGAGIAARIYRHDAGTCGIGGRYPICQRRYRVRTDLGADERVCRGKEQP